MIRVGLGYDSHRFQPPGPLILGGMAIPFDNHLHGHSDGDAVCHAVTDALLGAAAGAAGLPADIGEMFPDRDPRNARRNSLEMLGEAVRRVHSAGFRVAQADVTVILESPRLAEHKATIRANLARALAVDAADVAVKAKTNEGLGWIGRGEGIACVAIATLVKA